MKGPGPIWRILYTSCDNYLIPAIGAGPHTDPSQCLASTVLWKLKVESRSGTASTFLEKRKRRHPLRQSDTSSKVVPDYYNKLLLELVRMGFYCYNHQYYEPSIWPVSK